MQLLRPFDERELELIIGGLQAIDVQDWKANTRLKHCTPETAQVQWFWLVRKIAIVFIYFSITAQF